MFKIANNILFELFFAFWELLNILFGWIETIFRSTFIGIPENALPFLIGIWCYSGIAWFKIWVDNQENDSKNRLIAMIFYSIFLGIVILFSIWRIGIASMITGRITPETLSLFLINMIYLTFGIALFYSFYRNNEWISRLLKVFLWIMFLLAVYLICPILEGFVPNNDTLTQILLTGAIFGIPNGIIYKRKKSRKDVLD